MGKNSEKGTRVFTGVRLLYRSHKSTRVRCYARIGKTFDRNLKDSRRREPVFYDSGTEEEVLRITVRHEYSSRVAETWYANSRVSRMPYKSTIITAIICANL